MCRTFLVLILLLGLPVGASGEDQPLTFRVELTKAHEGFDGESCWVHARAGAIPAASTENPGSPPTVVMTMQKLLLSGSDVFYALNSLQTQDLSASWSSPVEQQGFQRKIFQPDVKPFPPGAAGAMHLLQPGDETVLCDFTPQWHRASGILLGVGHTAWYRNNKIFHDRPRATGYATYDVVTKTWNEWKALEIPDVQELQISGAGCVQRFDLENGDVLLPVYGRSPGEKQARAVVLRCRFDGKELVYVEHGNFLGVPQKRGVAEPSLTRFQDRFFLTIRHDDRGYVSVSDDGLHFTEPKAWTFNDGSDLGNYNTQQHWVTHSDGLFLVYTRRGANNDHVFRHRAPLFIAQVDPEKLHVIRSTEVPIVPERGARLGNFGIVDVSPQETWVTAAEWMQPKGVEKYGSNNTVYVARLLWDRPNRVMETAGE